MYKLDNFFEVLNGIAPIRLSHELIKLGDYDNSGILVRGRDSISKVLFSLDLTNSCVKRAKRLGCDAIVTHHPAIYAPVKSLSIVDPVTSPVLYAIQNKFSVISMHLNLDIVAGGIDDELAKGLGANTCRTIDSLDEKNGYGKEFVVSPVQLRAFVSNVKKEFNSNKIIFYGNPQKLVSKCASFCGGGSTCAEKSVTGGMTDADVIITSDMPHHVIKELIELEKSIVILPHYVAEEYGFRRFFNNVKETVKNDIKVCYFDDKRFR